MSVPQTPQYATWTRTSWERHSLILLLAMFSSNIEKGVILRDRYIVELDDALTVETKSLHCGGILTVYDYGNFFCSLSPVIYISLYLKRVSSATMHIAEQ